MLKTPLSSTEPSDCPHQGDDRKSARIAAERLRFQDGARRVVSYPFARDILRSSKMKQAGVGAEQVDTGNPDHAPVFYLDGEAHRKKRGAIARFFTPTAVATRYRPLMQKTAEAIIARVHTTGRASLDKIAHQMTVAVAAEIVGLTNSNQATMATRISATLSAPPRRWRWATRLLEPIAVGYRALNFFYRDVRPAIRARRGARRDDIISHLLDEGYSDRAIWVECMTYAAAGMVTTRELIVMAAWHLFERDSLRIRFLEGGDEDQFAILEEILRLEPVAGMLFRRAAEEISDAPSGPIPSGTLFNIDIRAANGDESVVGSCPHGLDPDRAKTAKAGGGSLSFGHGSHRCPGSQVALHETRVFLDRLLRLPGIRLEREPQIRWHEMLMSYELRNAVVACDAVPQKR
jgi:cytochrome P450